MEKELNIVYSQEENIANISTKYNNRFNNDLKNPSLLVIVKLAKPKH